MAMLSFACCCQVALFHVAAGLEIRTQPEWHTQLAWTDDVAKHIASLRDLPPPDLAKRSIASARAHHQDALRRAAAVERAAGHARPAPPLLPTTRVPSSTGHRVNPAMYGADPSGKEDSTEAFARAMESLLNMSTHGGKSMAVNIADLGGATFDLAGGEFLLSQPVIIPQFVGNLHFTDGTLRAHPSFPRDKWLVMIGSDDCRPKTATGSTDGQDSCNELITFTDLLFDAAHVAAGGLHIAHVMGATVRNSFLIGFKKVGVNITGGHEVMISDSWLAECYWSQFAPLMPTDPCSPEWNSESVGIQINGPDNSLVNVIVFGFTRVGVEVLGHCNLLYGVHAWNSAPLPISFKPGVGISLGGPNSPFNDHNDNRVIGSYLDFNTLDLYDPSHTVVEGTMFLSTYANLYSMRRSDKWGDAEIDGLVMHGNTYTIDKSTVVRGSFKKLMNVIISDEINAAKSTRARMVLTQKSSTRWEFDFTKLLVFPDIEQIQYSVISNSPTFFQHIARPPKGAKVVVETSVAVDATIVVEAWQGIGGTPTIEGSVVEL